MKKIISFLSLVEIQTKTASVIPFIIGLLFSIYRYNQIEPINLTIMFISMICLDMATTAINNYMDFKKTQEENIIFVNNLQRKHILMVIFLLLVLSLTAGFILFIRTDLIVLFIGIIGFIIGILYSYGPIPLSYTPLGELLSGTVMGGLIFFVTVYIQQEPGFIISYQIEQWVLSIDININECIILLIVSIPSIVLIANIMLANNLCDMDKDSKNGRKTLPIVLGRKWGLYIFNFLYLITYLSVIGAVILDWLPVISLLVLLTVFPVYKNLKIFYKKQDKSETFVLSVKNFVLISLTNIVALILGIVIT